MNDIAMTIIGNVVNDVEMRFTPSGEAVAKFRVAAGTRRYDRVHERWVDGDTHYLSVSCWRGLAHNVVHSEGSGMTPNARHPQADSTLLECSQRSVVSDLRHQRITS
jgi:hypothetical protein